MKKIISLFLSGFLPLVLVPHGFAAVSQPGMQMERSVVPAVDRGKAGLPAVAGAKAGLAENPTTTPCSRLPKGNVFQSALGLAHETWQKKNHSLRLRGLSAWNEEHRKFLEVVEERKKQHFDRVIQCTAMREEVGTEPVMREGTRFVIFYPSSITARAELPGRLAQTGRETAAGRTSYFSSVRSEERKTRRTIRQEHRERIAAGVIP